MTNGGLTSPALERLLATLDQDRERAAHAYERLRARVSGLLRWWGAPDVDELTDETLDRVARKLEEGTVVAEGSLGAYVRGVARMIFYESSRRPRMLTDVPDQVLAPGENPDEAAMSSLESGLAALSPADREVVLRYYGDGKAADIRRQLAAELGISPTALRVRAHRIREQLEQRVRAELSGR